MGWTFRKTKKLGPFRLTASKRGIGASVGVKGARVTKKAGGGVTRTVSVPGTGLRNTKTVSSKRK